VTRPFKLGLTGSIGMGKSTTGAMFADLGIPIWDADQAVHRLYGQGGGAVHAMAARFPQAIENGAVSRKILKEIITLDRGALSAIEAVVHPLVALDRLEFMAGATSDMVVLDIPLLFENDLRDSVDATLLVTAPASLQRRRVLDRAGMTEDHLATILARQMPDAMKRQRATHIVETLDFAATRAYVAALVTYLRAAHA